MYVDAIGRAPPSNEFEGSNVLHGAINAIGYTVEVAKAAAAEASSVLKVLHESLFPDKEVQKELDALAGSVDKGGDILMDLACDNTMSALDITLMVLLGHGVSIDFDTILLSVSKYIVAHSRQATAGTHKLQETPETHAQSQGGAAQD